MLLISSTFLLFHLSWKCINIKSSLDILLCNGKLYIEYHFTLWLWSVMFEQFLLSGFVDFIIHLFLIQITLSGMISYQIIDDKTDMNLKILWYWKVSAVTLTQTHRWTNVVISNFKLLVWYEKIMLKCFSAACVRAKTLNTKLTIYFFEVFIRKRKIYIGRKIERD